MRKSRLERGKIKTAQANNAASIAPCCSKGLLILVFLILIVAAARAQSPLSSIIVTSSIPTNLRIDGPGYFIVEDPVSGGVFATRFGDFSEDENGFLVTGNGYRLQGLTLNPTNANTMIASSLNLEAFGPDYEFNIISYAFQNDGRLMVTYFDGTHSCIGQVQLQNFAAASLKSFLDGNWLIPTNDFPLPSGIPPGTDGVGPLQTEQLEFPLPNLSLNHAQPPAPGFAQGVLTETGIPTDLAIEGNGYFVARDTNSDTLYATRAGACYLDGDGYLVNYAGMRLQGYNTFGATNGDLQIPSDGMAMGDPAFLDYFDINTDGSISIELFDGSSFNVGQILLVNCAHPESLVKTNFGLYPMSASTGPWTNPLPPTTAGLGWVIAGNVEASQFDQSILYVRQHLNFFVQGSIETVSNVTDLAINGLGFFTVRDPANNVFYATRHGAFSVNGGWLVDTNGDRVQGFTNSALTGLGDVQIDATGAPPGTATNATVLYYNVGANGSVYVALSDGNIFVRDQITLQNYKNLQALVPLPGLLYSNVAATQPLYDAVMLANNVSTIIDGSLEVPFVPAPIPLPTADGFHIVVQQMASDSCLESSPDLVHWEKLTPLTPSDLWEAEFYDTNNPADPTRFYRVRQDW
jgi:flagellar hook protein FlgE